MISIDSNCGRIGNFWWVNADTEPKYDPLFMMVLTRLGTCGFGWHLVFSYERHEP
ncbi:MAG: hypothetical protein VKI63_00170 [Cyanobium sp.]|nr:hypothetical protein [Cyanobium sp.]